MDLEDMARIVGGAIVTVVVSALSVALITLTVKFAIGFYVPIIRFVWNLW